MCRDDTTENGCPAGILKTIIVANVLKTPLFGGDDVPTSTTGVVGLGPSIVIKSITSPLISPLMVETTLLIQLLCQHEKNYPICTNHCHQE
jgi:hypothetical protein